MKLRHALLGLSCAAALAACSDSNTGSNAPDVARTDAADVTAADIVTVPDVVVPDVPDVTAPDVAAADVTLPVDAPADATAPTDDGSPGRCTASSDCAASALGHACDVASGQCAPCTTSDRGSCVASEYCTAANRCEAGCGADSDCAGDGGVNRCDTMLHACVRCVIDDHCPGGQVCARGSCVPGCNASHACMTGQSCCGDACIDLGADPAHCGACATTCPTATNASPACLSGACGLTCARGFADCDADATNGCETGTDTSAASCGSCGVACTPGANAVAACVSGRCVNTCAAGFSDCDDNAANGCETSTLTSAASCGMCGRVCPDAANATATCAAGACGFTCAAGFADCDHDPANGCEAALSATASCGRCGNACSGATPVCSATSGACVTGCAATQARCGMSCEDTQTSVDHCGSCDNLCPEPTRAARTCAAGRCGYACETGYGDCDMSAANGCEVALQTSASNCGACGRACAPGLECRAGACAPAYATCKGILDAGLSVGDGVYTILLAGRATEVRCLMSVDGGGWTLAGNFPYPGGSTAGVPGWTSGAAVGASFTDLTHPFKLSDADINAMRTTGFRAHGSATVCAQGACSVDTTLYWRPTCLYASASNSPACYTAFRDVAYTVPESSTAPCDWHWGLVASNCSSTATMGTSHVGDHVFVGNYASYVHAYDGRAGENPSVQFWVR